MTDEEVLEVVKEVTAKVLDIDTSAMTLDGTLGELGANSVDRADIVTLAMIELNAKIPPSKFKGVNDIRSLVDALRRHSS
jgi:polyketide biosynthesis acyl carrier protein